MASVKKSDLTATSLKDALWDTLNRVQKKNLDPAAANAIASQAREIARIVKLEIQVAVLSGRKPSGMLVDFTDR